MNILTDALPHSVEIDGAEYRVDADFRTCLRVMMAFEDSELIIVEKQAILLSNLFVDIPEDLESAAEKAMQFLNGGQDGKSANGPRVYAFAKDAGMIFAAFKQVHGIDLTTADLHWWEFSALFQALIAHQENVFGALVTLRHRLKTGKATKEERAAARGIPDLIDIPDVDTRTLQEKEREAEFLRLVEQGKRKREAHG